MQRMRAALLTFSFLLPGALLEQTALNHHTCMKLSTNNCLYNLVKSYWHLQFTNVAAIIIDT